MKKSKEVYFLVTYSYVTRKGDTGAGVCTRDECFDHEEVTLKDLEMLKVDCILELLEIKDIVVTDIQIYNCTKEQVDKLASIYSKIQ